MSGVSIIDVTRDPQGLTLAMAELLEEGFAMSRVAGTLEHCDEDTLRRIDQSREPRKLSPGYYRMALYLFWLEEQVNLGSVSKDFCAFECEGLALAKHAHGEFSERHPRCTACGAAQESKFATSCYACHASFKRGED